MNKVFQNMLSGGHIRMLTFYAVAMLSICGFVYSIDSIAGIILMVIFLFRGIEGFMDSWNSVKTQT